LPPVRGSGVIAAIVFSDIIVIQKAMGVEVLMEEGKGPVLPHVIKTEKDIISLFTDKVEEKLDYVMKALTLTKQELNGEVPLIGFAGAPWTILCYMVEGKGSKTWEKAKEFCFTQPDVAHRLLQKITDTTIHYLKAQIKAGADVVQIFDSWAGSLGPEDFKRFAQPYLIQIADALQDDAPVILFPKGSWYALEELSESSASALGIDWCISPKMARELTSGKITLQGNFDPAKLLLPIDDIQKEAKKMISEFGVQKYVVNLGHGITPNIPVDHARAFVDAVKGGQW
jgi:uroporphyrinogen decarboxylase